MQIQTASAPWRRARRTNQTGGYPTVAPQTLDPRTGLSSAAGATVREAIGAGIDTTPANSVGATSQNIIQMMFFGAGADNATMLSRLYGWAKVDPFDAADLSKNLWVPCLIAEFSLILSTAVGVANTQVVATDRFADTVSLTIGNTAKVTITSPGTTTANLIGALVEVDFTGFQLLEPVFSDNSSATSMNALYRTF